MLEPTCRGHYARKQIYCPNQVVAWSHRQRFRLALRLAVATSGERLLDFGCGDATFLALARERFRGAVGADVDEAQLADCRRRFGSLGIEFVHTSRLEAPEHEHAYDVVTCMEVLEHCLDDERRHVLGELARLTAPDGAVIISVPIEVGPALPAKQLVRALAAWHGQGDYRWRERYRPAELLAAAAGRRVARAEYVVDGPDGPRRYCGHKGFDWRVLAREIDEWFTVEQRVFTPIRLFRSLLNSQAWFVGRRR